MPRLLSSLSLVLVLMSPGFMTCQSLEHESKAAVSSLTFDVASIRPARDHSGRWMIAMPPAPGRFSATGITLMSLVEYAYHSHHLRSFQIVDAPDWAYSDRFDISAKTDDAGTEAGTGHGTSPTDEKDHIDERNCIRLQALLADRFHLKVRFDSKMMPVLVMTSVKGSKLKASSTTSGIITSGFGILKVTGVTPAAIAAA